MVSSTLKLNSSITAAHTCVALNVGTGLSIPRDYLAIYIRGKWCFRVFQAQKETILGDIPEIFLFDEHKSKEKFLMQLRV